MRDSETDQKPSVLIWLIAAIISAFVVEVFFLPVFRDSSSIIKNLELTVAGLRVGHVWTLFTYGFVHWTPPSNLLHVVGVVAGVFIFGRELLPALGTRRFVALYTGSLVLGGLAWAVANWHHRGETVLFGGVPGVYGLLTVFACFYPHRDFSFTFFFIPVTLKPKHLAIGLALVEFVAFIFYELYGAFTPFPYAPSAHLGGMAAGLIYYRFVHTARWQTSSSVEEIDASHTSKIRPVKTLVLEPVARNPTTRDELRAEVDRILDKINSSGFSALTAAEKQVLDNAKDQLTRR